MFAKLPSPFTSSRLLIGIFCAGLVLRSILLFVGTDFLVAYRLPDDALYYFAIAKNIIAGHGISFDGVVPTNGFHPLWLAMLLPIFLLQLGNWESIHAVMAFQTVLDAFVLVLVGGLTYDALRGASDTYRKRGALLALLAYAVNPTAIIRGVNGLETTITSLLLLLWTWNLLRLHRSENIDGQGTITGILTGLLVLARTDATILILPALLWLLFARQSIVTRRFIGNALLAIVLLAIPWLVWNYVTFGSLMQVSAEAVPFVAMKRFDASYGAYGKYLFLIPEAIRNMTKPFAYSTGGLGLITLVAWLVKRSKFKAGAVIGNTLLPVVTGALLLLAVHTIFRGFIREWYVEQLTALFSVVFGVTSLQLVAVADGRRSLVTIRLIAGVLLLALAALWVVELRTPHMSSQRAMAFAGVPYVQDLAPGSKLAAFNSGYYGFFAPENVRIVNLDGVVNERAFDAIRQGALREYLKDQAVDDVLDFKGDVVGYASILEPSFLHSLQLDSVLGAAGIADSLSLYRVKVSN